MSIKTKHKQRKVKLYSKDIIDDMRERLCKAESEGVLSKKNKLVHKILWEGCHGWKNIHDAIVITQYEEVYGEYKK
jgi:hypothetical protein